MAENTRAFFDELAQQQSVPVTRGTQGTCRFDIAGSGTWMLEISDGTLHVSQRQGDADCTFACPTDVFDRMVRGEANATVMFMQGKAKVTSKPGKIGILYVVDRLLPPTQSAVLTSASTPTPRHPDEASQPIIPRPDPTGAPPQKPSKTVSILEGNTFVVSQVNGNIDALPTDTQGLFAWDTRFLSKWLLTVNGVEPRALSTDDLNYYAVRFFLVPTTGTVYVDAKISVIRTREVGHGFQETITIMNHASSAVDLEVRLAVGCDFADAFEVKDALKKQGAYQQRVEGRRLILEYTRETFRRVTWIEADESAHIEPESLTYQAHIEGHGVWTTEVMVVVADAGTGERHTSVTYDRTRKSAKDQDLKTWIAEAPKVASGWAALSGIYQRSIIDLAALRFYPTFFEGQSLPAAGLPWFMAIFGRDSLITSYQALPFTPELAETTLLALAARQGSKMDDFRDEEPGKIIHEIRNGEMTAFEERPQSPYYGSADATPLFLILLDELERWSGNALLIKKLEWPARWALEWIDRYGDHDGDGYIDYNRRNTVSGLENQCWKDSWDSILFADGKLSQLPRATCEIQGYVYDAKVRCARLARRFWNDPELADRLEREAADLKRRFNQDFWLPDRGYFALALDGEHRKVDALTSNIGHLLWSGIVETDKAAACVKQLMGKRLFSGWGIRTMAEGDGGYNPIGYHVGTVWPHDNSIIAQGLVRYGYREEAARLAMGILEAATFFHNRLPEAFAGYDRSLTEYPVEYPTACSPQAWSTGAPLLMLRAIMGLEPIGDNLLINPVLPDALGWLGIFDVVGRWGKTDAFARRKQRSDEQRELPPLMAIQD